MPTLTTVCVSVSLKDHTKTRGHTVGGATATSHVDATGGRGRGDEFRGRGGKGAWREHIVVCAGHVRKGAWPAGLEQQVWGE